MSSKIISGESSHMADLIVDAALSVEDEGTVDIDNIVIIKKQGESLSDTQLIKGLILDKERVHTDMPKLIKNAKILLINAALETNKT